MEMMVHMKDMITLNPYVTNTDAAWVRDITSVGVEARIKKVLTPDYTGVLLSLVLQVGLKSEFEA